MREVLYRYLLDRPGGAPSHELLDLVFTQPGRDTEFGPHFLRTLLGRDPRFAYRADDDWWVARLNEILAVPLEAARFVVLDIETTGGAADTGGITELAAVRLGAGGVEAEFQQLINPRAPVQPFVTQLTGITDAMLSDQPVVEEVLPRFLDFAGEHVLVAHNASFDLGFLNAAMRRHLGHPVPQPHLCTLRLARRLVPHLRRRSLDALAEHFGVEIRDRHRALGDARMTADVLVRLLEISARRGVSRLDELLDLQSQARDGRRFVCSLPAARVRELPDGAGVYEFLGDDGRLLYVGRSRSLRHRVGSYLHNSRAHSDRTLDLIRHIRAVEVTETGSDLEAALLEAEMIRTRQPPYNRLGKHLPQLGYLKLVTRTQFPRLTVVTRLGTDRALFFGPFRSRSSAERLRDVLLRLFQVRTCPGTLEPDPATAVCFLGQIDMCTAPCAARVDAARYGTQVEQLVRVLEGDGTWARELLAQRREAHSAALRFEAAARAHRDLAEIEGFLLRSRTLGWAVQRQSFLILVPAGASAQAYVALGGRLAHRRTLRAHEELGQLENWIHSHWESYARAPLCRQDIEAATVLAGWLRSRRASDGYVFPLTYPDLSAADWVAALSTILGSGRY